MSIAIYWFTNDLRIADNPGLRQAAEADYILPIYVYDPQAPHPIQGASAWWLHQSLVSLDKALNKKGNAISIFSGNPLEQLQGIYAEHPFDQLFCARAYTPHERLTQEAIHKWCSDKGIEFKRFAGGLLLEPESVQNKSNSYFKVFTPFYKYYQQQYLRSPAVAISKPIPTCTHTNILSLKVEALNLLPNQPNWAEPFSNFWQPGEEGAHSALAEAIDSIITHYSETRDLVAVDGTSKLSAHLRFGEISPAQIWNEVRHALPNEDSESFLRQLVWRDFNQHLLFHRSELPNECFNKKFEHFSWETNNDFLEKWQKGQTGYPLVDAAMRQLWHTGWMHNRARMVVASFLTKHLLVSWRDGANWFWDTLVDADLANNIGGWQWTAGCGADAAPYFRIFNPITQGERFDPKGLYTKKWIPELDALPLKYLFKPWEAPDDILQSANVKLGFSYPLPIVDHKEARKKALDAYSASKG